MVGQRTTGLSLSTGRGATFAALETRALRRRVLRPGWIYQFYVHCDCGLGHDLVPGRSGSGLDVANPFGNLQGIRDSL